MNEYLVSDLKRLNLWNESMRDMIKYFDGNISQIKEIPQEVRTLYKASFDIDPKRLLDLTAVRAKWIDQSQSHNIFVKGTSGKQIHEIYLHAWKCGLKTTYYLRSLGASQVEKSTLSAQKFGYTQKRVYEDSLAHKKELSPQKTHATIGYEINTNSEEPVDITACEIDDPDCEACQ